jgi:hypothetical protein
MPSVLIVTLKIQGENIAMKVQDYRINETRYSGLSFYEWMVLTGKQLKLSGPRTQEQK